MIRIKTTLLPLKYSHADLYTRFATNVSICWSLSRFLRHSNVTASEP